MKNPHVALAIGVAMLALISCQREDVAIDNSVPVVDNSIMYRCCDGEIDQMLEDPVFIDIYSHFLVSIIEPGVTVFELMDSAYLALIVDRINLCLEQGGDVVACLDSAQFLLTVKGFLANYNLVDSLQSELASRYSHLDPDEFYQVFLGAFQIRLEEDLAELFGGDLRQIPCYLTYQKAIVKSWTDFIDGVVTLDPLAIPHLYRDLTMARITFCDCLYNEYGTGC